MSLDGRTIIVTGASRGIGRETSIVLAEQGARVVSVARDERLLEALVAELPGSDHKAAPMDVRDEAAWDQLVADLPRIDGVVAAAGVYGPIGRIDRIDIDTFREAFEVNVLGVLLAVRASLPKLGDGGGSVVLFAGGGAEPLSGYDAYVSSKAAVVRLAENLGEELRELRVRVNAVAPGFIATDIHRATLAAGPDAAGADFYARTVQALDQGGFPAREAASLVAHLMTNATEHLTGRLFSARWDPWRRDDWLRDVGRRADLLTMRRIDDDLFAPAKQAR